MIPYINIMALLTLEYSQLISNHILILLMDHMIYTLSTVISSQLKFIIVSCTITPIPI